MVEKKRRTKVDLAFPTVVINLSAGKDKRRRRKLNNYRFMGVILVCLLLLVHFIDRNILRLPPAEVKVDFSHVSKISDLSIDAIESWCLAGVSSIPATSRKW